MSASEAAAEAIAAMSEKADKAQVTREAIALGLTQMKRRKPQ